MTPRTARTKALPPVYVGHGWSIETPDGRVVGFLITRKQACEWYAGNMADWPWFRRHGCRAVRSELRMAPVPPRSRKGGRK